MARFTREQLDIYLDQCNDDSLPWQYFNRQVVRFLIEDLIEAQDTLHLYEGQLSDFI